MYTGTLHLFPAYSGVYCVGAKSLKTPLSEGLCQLDAVTQDLGCGRAVAITFLPTLVGFSRWILVATKRPHFPISYWFGGCGEMVFLTSGSPHQISNIWVASLSIP